MPTDVVIVDDDAGFRAVARELLESSGIAVVADVADGAGALNACRRHRPNGVLLDVNLPDTTGHVLARTLQREQPGLRILLTSTESSVGGLDDVPFLPKVELALADLAAYFSN